MGYVALLALCCGAVALAQEPSRTGQEQVPTFQSKVNLVLVPVVVRDSQGRPIANLTKDDFQLFDKGKRQPIASFSAIDRAARAGLAHDANAAMQSATPARAAAEAKSSDQNESAKRYLIYLFDDVNIGFASTADVREAAVRYFRNDLAAEDRAAIYTVSGNPTPEFTSDREKLEQTVSKLRWRPRTGSGMQCPDVSYYIADLIINKADGQALDGLTQHIVECAHVRWEVARDIAFASANRELIVGAHNTDIALRTLRRAIQRLSEMPGERSIILASPGFFTQTPAATKAMAGALNLAAKSNVIISALSVRGVIVAEEEQGVAEGRGSMRRAPPSQTSPGQLWLRYRRESARAEGDALKDLAEGTGGTFFHNNNDLHKGFEQVAAIPEFSYVIGFSPAEWKPDGSFHSLKVRLPAAKPVSIEARRGYYAVETGSTDEATADLNDAVFSRDQRNDIPVVLQTGYSKLNTSNEAKVLIVAKMDVRSSDFQKAVDRTRDSLSVVAALFDSHGDYVQGAAQTVNLKLLRAIPKPNDPALTLRWQFDVKPDAYVIRLVIREPESKAITMLNRTVKIL